MISCGFVGQQCFAGKFHGRFLLFLTRDSLALESKKSLLAGMIYFRWVTLGVYGSIPLPMHCVLSHWASIYQVSDYFFLGIWNLDDWYSRYVGTFVHDGKKYSIPPSLFDNWQYFTICSSLRDHNNTHKKYLPFWVLGRFTLIRDKSSGTTRHFTSTTVLIALLGHSFIVPRE